jgi:hypothetical protein
MSESAGLVVRQSHQRVALKVLLYLVILVSTGCFGPGAMHYDVQKYNKQVLSSEKEMLLYNIAALRREEPPHFMMVSNIAATRTYSAAATFSFTNLWNKLFAPAGTTSTNIKGANTYVGGVAAGVIENPTISFVPIQGQDFANRFETPLAGQLSLLIEDVNLNEDIKEHQWLMLLFAQGLEIKHGDYDCPTGDYKKRYDYFQFSKCVEHIMTAPNREISEIDTNHVIQTAAPKEQPTAADVVSAQQANLSWVKVGSDYQLATSLRIPAWLDFAPKFTPPPGPNDDLAKNQTPLWWQYPAGPETPRGLDWKYLGYQVPPKYQWFQWRDANGNKKIVLLPEKKVLWCKNGANDCVLKAEDKPIRGRIPQPDPDNDPNSPDKKTEFSYGNEVADYLWPVPYDDFYVELRRNEVNDQIAKGECFEDKPAQNDVVCGFFKIGNLIQIMKSLGDLACTEEQGSLTGTCPLQSVFGVGSNLLLGPRIRRPTRTLLSRFVQFRMNGFGCPRTTPTFRLLVL